jgi:hypothetical protein
MTLTAPRPEVENAPSRWQRVRPPVLLAGAVIGVSVALHFRDPHESGSWGFCPWLVLTGTYCPGCGGLRAVNDLGRGDLGAAASSNLLFVSAIPLVAWVWIRSVSQRWRGVRRPLPASTVKIAVTVGIVLATGFWVVRNLSFGAWLAP